MNELHLSIGSNIDNRLDYLNKSIDLISKKVGNICLKSNIYETPAWGFESTPFLNSCISITSHFSTKQILIKLQEIEKELGRQTKTSTTYEARPIDIDIIYTSEGLFNTPNLVVPHPLMHKRKFVLTPLLDICKDYKHPLLHKTTEILLTECSDDSVITLFKE